MAECEKEFVTNQEVQNRCVAWVKSQAKLTELPVDRGLKREADSEQDECFDTDSEFISVSECGTKRRRAVTQIKREVLNLQCKWRDCDLKTSSMDEFVKHVAGHIPQLDITMNKDDSEVYVCLWEGCNYESNISADITRHVNYHSYHCKLQSIGTNVRARINLPRCHRLVVWKTVLNPRSPQICQWDDCLRSFTNYELFLYHVNQHLESNPRGNNIAGGVTCKWTGCAGKYGSLYKLRDHVRSHTKEKIVGCPDCGATFASHTKFHQHCRRQIPIEMQGFQCSYCNKYYPTECILREHMRFHVYNYKCTLCDMSCGSPASLVKHVRYRHVSTRPFPCQLCSHAAKSQQDLDSHMTVHTSGPNFFCNYEGCTYTCKNAYVFDRHIERVHADEMRWYCCHECPVKYRKSYTLTKHLIEAHNLEANGHKRFQYTRDDDGYYRLQMVRYEAIDDDSPSSSEKVELQAKNYKIKVNNTSHLPELEIVEDRGDSEGAEKEDEDDDDDDDDDDEEGEEEEDEAAETISETISEPEYSVGKSMPIISNILISIDEMDADGNIIDSRIVQTQETTELPPSDEPPIILT